MSNTKDSNEFVWTDELAWEFAKFASEDSPAITKCAILNHFKESKKPKPLFITDDDIPAYEDEVVWVVNTSFAKFHRIVGKDVWRTKDPTMEVFKFYSTKEKAEEYILMNKPILSLIEVGGILSGNITPHIAEELKKLVKSKL